MVTSGKVKRNKEQAGEGVAPITREPYNASPKCAAPAELGKGVGSDASPWAIGRERAGAGGYGSLEEGRGGEGRLRAPAIFSSGGAKFGICNLEAKLPWCRSTKTAAIR